MNSNSMFRVRAFPPRASLYSITLQFERSGAKKQLSSRESCSIINVNRGFLFIYSPAHAIEIVLAESTRA